MIDERQSYLVHPDGTKIQVLRPAQVRDHDTGEMVAGVEWDEAATHAAYRDYDAAKSKG